MTTPTTELCGAEAYTVHPDGSISLHGVCDKPLGHWPADRFHASKDGTSSYVSEWCGPTEDRAPLTLRAKAWLGL